MERAADSSLLPESHLFWRSNDPVLPLAVDALEIPAALEVGFQSHLTASIAIQK
jgi:hypothetical protein